jgi:hypothetical protein
LLKIGKNGSKKRKQNQGTTKKLVKNLNFFKITKTLSRNNNKTKKRKKIKKQNTQSQKQQRKKSLLMQMVYFGHEG